MPQTGAERQRAWRERERAKLGPRPESRSRQDRFLNERREQLTAESARTGLPAPALPRSWNNLSPVEKLGVLYGMSLENAFYALSYRGTDPMKVAERSRMSHDVLMIAQRWAIEASRTNDRERVVDALREMLDPNADSTIRERAAKDVSILPIDGTKGEG